MTLGARTSSCARSTDVKLNKYPLKTNTYIIITDAMNDSIEIPKSPYWMLHFIVTHGDWIAIVCGLLIFAVAGLILAPVFHRILHRFHVRDDIPEDPKTQ